MDLYEKYFSAKENQIKIQPEIEVNENQIRELRDKIYQLQIDELNANKQRVQNAIDLNDGKGKPEQYNELIAYEEEALRINEIRIQNAKAYLDTLEEGTQKYKEQHDIYNDLINDSAQMEKNIKDGATIRMEKPMQSFPMIWYRQFWKPRDSVISY